MKQEELLSQIHFFNWCRYESKDPRLALAFAVPNGGHRAIHEARTLKASGVLAGVPDVFVPIPSAGYHGLFLEFKSEKGRLTPEQKNMIESLRQQGYRVEVVRSGGQAIDVLLCYLLGTLC